MSYMISTNIRAKNAAQRSGAHRGRMLGPFPRASCVAGPAAAAARVDRLETVLQRPLRAAVPTQRDAARDRRRADVAGRVDRLEQLEIAVAAAVEREKHGRVVRPRVLPRDPNAMDARVRRLVDVERVDARAVVCELRAARDVPARERVRRLRVTPPEGRVVPYKKCSSVVS